LGGIFCVDGRFDKFNISSLSLKAIHEVMGFTTMTVVQDATLPAILKGQDVLAKAKTGTGKTVAFLLPAIETILKTRGSQGFAGRSPVNVVIICPTRELASQAAKEATMLMTFQKGLGVQVVIGGTNMNSETKRLGSQPCQVITILHPDLSEFCVLASCSCIDHVLSFVTL
jgi:ATP-dependent RNA helicase MSS116